MPKMKYWNGTAWIILDAADADTVDGKHASDFAPATHVGAGGAAHSAATSSSNGFMTSDMVTKLGNIAAGAEVNQMAFSNVKVGATTLAADAATDTLEFVAGSNITLTPDAATDRITIAATFTNSNAFGNIKVGATTIAADASSDILELAGTTGITLAPDTTNDKVTFSVDQTVSSETQPASPYNGMIWYNPVEDAAKVYLNGAFRSVGGNEVTAVSTSLKGQVVVSSTTNTVALPVSYNPAMDTLFVFQNSTFIQEGIDYTVSGSSIVKSSGSWTGGSTVIDVVVIGMTETSTNVTDIQTLAAFTSAFIATENNTSTVPVNVPEYAPDADVLEVYYKNLVLHKGDEWVATPNKQSIVLQGFTINTGEKIHFRVLKKIRDQYVGTIDGAAILNGSIDNVKLKPIDGSILTDNSIDRMKLKNLGAANGIATLGADGKVPASQLSVSSSADQITVVDAGGYFTASHAEGALQEIGQVLNSLRGNLITSANNILGS